MAHEINNPLTSVVGNLQVSLESIREIERGEPVPELMQDALVAANRNRAVVQDLRMLSRPGDETQDTVDIERVIDAALRMARNETRHRATVQTEFGGVRLVAATESGGESSRPRINPRTWARHRVAAGSWLSTTIPWSRHRHTRAGR